MKNIDTILSFDVGTGSVRASLIAMSGQILELNSRPIDTYFPMHGRSEQRPEDWWNTFCDVSRETVQASKTLGCRIVAVAGCGQMHAPVLIDRNGGLVNEYVDLWNDKRAEPQVNVLKSRPDIDALCATAGNPPASSWPGIKLLWAAQNRPGDLDKAQWVLMPKDFINFRLTGTPSQDRTEAGSSFLFSHETNNWSDSLVSQLGLPRRILPEVRKSWEQNGSVSNEASDLTGIPPGTPVFTGGGDYPLSVLGSGVYQPGEISDITGTSSLLSLIAEHPLQNDQITNAATPDKHWMNFCLVDAAGDAIRWGRRHLEDGNLDFEDLTRAAQSVPAGAGGLIFLPYLTGERLGHGPNARAAFIGLTAAHGKAEMHRAILEGTALGLRIAAEPMLRDRPVPDQIIAAGGGARSRVLLEIKASIFNTPFVPVKEVECGLIGSAALAMCGLGIHASPGDAVKRLVHYQAPVMPDPEALELYGALREAFAHLRDAVAPAWATLNRSDTRGSA